MCFFLLSLNIVHPRLASVKTDKKQQVDSELVLILCVFFLFLLHRHDEQDRMERRERDKQARAQAERDAEPPAPIFAAPVKVVSELRETTSP